MPYSDVSAAGTSMAAPMDITAPLMNGPNAIVLCLQVFAGDERFDVCCLTMSGRLIMVGLLRMENKDFLIITSGNPELAGVVKDVGVGFGLGVVMGEIRRDSCRQLTARLVQTQTQWRALVLSGGNLEFQGLEQGPVWAEHIHLPVPNLMRLDPLGAVCVAGGWPYY